jgi:hypothetical protein
MSRPLTFAAIILLALAAGCADQPQPVESKPYAFWPPFPNEPHILYLASYASNTDIEPPRSQMDELVYGKEPLTQIKMGNPYGVAMWNGRIYVCDTRNPNVEILDLRKHHMELMSAPDKMRKPVAIIIAPDGMKYVADNAVGMGSIVVFDAGDHFVRQIGHEGFQPVAVAVHGNYLYATDLRANHIEVYDRTSGAPVRTIGEFGKKPGQFSNPLGVATDDNGDVYVDDIVNCRVQKFSPDGKLLGAFGALGDHPGTFTRPKHIAIDHDGDIFVVDAAFENVQMFDKQFKGLMFFGGAGNYPGAMELPAGISVHDGDLDLFADKIPAAFQADRLVLVTNQAAYGVNVYAMGHLKPGHTMDELAVSKGLIPQGTTTQPATGVGAPLPESTTQPAVPH